MRRKLKVRSGKYSAHGYIRDLKWLSNFKTHVLSPASRKNFLI